MFLPDDTIVAIATPPGRGGLGVVRLSGPRAAAMAGDMLDRRRPLAPRRATFCRRYAGWTARRYISPRTPSKVPINDATT